MNSPLIRRELATNLLEVVTWWTRTGRRPALTGSFRLNCGRWSRRGQTSRATQSQASFRSSGISRLRVPDGRTVVIATEFEDNSGTSITNACEQLANRVCIDFAIDASKLVWIEHYGYPFPSNPRRPRTSDLATFTILPPGHDAVFASALEMHLRQVRIRRRPALDECAQDGVVNALDFNILASRFGISLAPPAPGSNSLMSASVLPGRDFAPNLFADRPIVENALSADAACNPADPPQRGLAAIL